MKYLILFALVYLAYRLFYERPNSLDRPASRRTIFSQKSKKRSDTDRSVPSDDDDYIDYEEVD